MELKNFFEKINKKIDYLDKNVKNPFLSKDASLNPFEKAFKRTYVWVEEEEKNNK